MKLQWIIALLCFFGTVMCDPGTSRKILLNTTTNSSMPVWSVRKIISQNIPTTLPEIDNGIATIKRYDPNINYEKLLVRALLKDYDVSVRPIKNSSVALNLTFGSALTQIIDVDERNQILTVNCWINQMWVDSSLSWNPDDFGGVKQIRIPTDLVWKPDVILYNNADSQYNQAIISTNVIVKYNGNLTWLSSAIFKSSCQINVEFFPFDEQRCTQKFASWTYDGHQVDLLINDEAGDLSNYVPNGEWDLITVQVKRNVIRYSCCDESYPDITYTIVLRRRPLFYVFNLILPCVLISGLALLSFYMPSESGEKVTLGITTLLSMTVFLMVIGESMPPTSEKLPLIGLYYGVTICLVSFATGLSVVTLSIHHRGIRGGRLPNCVGRFLFNYLAPFLLLKLDIPKKRLLEEKYKRKCEMESALGNRCCKIPLADVWRVVYPGLPSTPSTMTCHCDPTKREFNLPCRKPCRYHNRCISYCELANIDKTWQSQVEAFNSTRPVMRVKGIPCQDGVNSCEIDEETSTPHTQQHQVCSSSGARVRNNWESQLLDTMHRILETMEKNEKRMEEIDTKDVIKLEWQQAALIIDRLLLWIFVATTVVATFSILYMSPYTKLFTH